MKIRVNYDLIDKIRESKSGISLKRFANKTALYTSTYSLLSVPKIYFSADPLEELFKTMIKGILLYSLLIGGTSLLCASLAKKASISELKILSSLLRSTYVNTDYELLQNAYEYERKYSFMVDDEKIPKLKQEKYIMVPVVDRDGEKEVSLVQEHIIGTREYELSYGSPKKVLKPVTSFA